MAKVKVKSLTKRYGAVTALDGVTLDAESGELISLLGPSGCGKSTTLRCVAGFLSPDSGDISVNDQSIVSTPSNRRDFGVVFQNYALFPHMTVAQNVGYGLLFRKIPKSEHGPRIENALRMVRLTGLADRLPKALSGGQQQRVALARALVIEPRLLLLDEPLANLDARLRDEVRWLIREVQQQSGTTAFYVTHDQAEAMAISDKVAVMKSGKVAQFATPRDIYQRPSERYVADFTGEANFLAARVLDASAGRFRIEVAGQTLDVPGVASLKAGDTAELLLRPESLSLDMDGASPRSLFTGVVSKAAFLGASQHCEISLGTGGVLKLAAPPNTSIAAGEQVGISVALEHAWLMPEVKP
ncbi:MAG: AAA family ATPase [Rhizobiales bacterium 63-7]|nr:ABC transporter ATP-binding protein [Hyphomicrobiales bacterium]OJU67277.1 MAG: AAA family ATPase [Rhizobiales bacterium 63-7]